LNDIKAIVNTLFRYICELDKEFESYVKPQKPVYGIHVMPGIALLLTHSVQIIKRFKAEFHIREYDHYILLFPDFLSVRAIRFCGERKSLDRNSSFLIAKLLKQKKGSQIGEELIGSFITEGKIENINASTLHILSILSLALIRPYLKYNTIIPSPLSFITHEIIEKGAFRKVYLSPSTITVILKDLKYRKFPVLGRILQGLFTDNAIAIAFDDLHGCFRKCNLKIFLPLIEGINDEDFKLYQEYIRGGGTVISHLLGLFVFEEEQPFLRSDTSGYFLAIQEIPFNVDIEALAIYGELQGFEFLSSSSRKYIYYYAVRSERKRVENFKDNIMKEIEVLEKKFNAYISFNKPQLIDFFKRLLPPGCLTSNEQYIELLAPPLIALMIMQNVKIEEILDIVSKLQKIKTLKEPDIKLELAKLSLTGRALDQKILDLMMKGVWIKAFSYQRELAKEWSLAYII